MALNIVQKNSTKCTNVRNVKIEYIVFHYTAGTTSRSGSAVNLASWYMSGSASASSDYIVDDTTIVQYNPDIRGRYTWGVGGNRYTSRFTSLSGVCYGRCTNMNCINIEVCSNKTNTKSLESTDTDWYFTEAELNLSAELIKMLMKEYNIDADHVIMHHQVTGKMCPAMWTRNESCLSGWYNFRTKFTSSGTSAPVTTTTPSTPNTKEYIVYTSIKGYMSADNAIKGISPVKTFNPGTYYIYKESNGSYNISTTAGAAGAWINPNDNVKPTEPMKKDEVVPTVEYSNTVVKVTSTDENLAKTVKYSTIFKYKDLITNAPTKPEQIVINTGVVKGIESLKSYLNLSKIEIVAGNAKDTADIKKITSCACPSNHVSGFAVDIICYAANGVKVPSSIICAAAKNIGFLGVGKINEFVSHIDMRKTILYWDASSGKNKQVTDFGVSQSEIDLIRNSTKIVDNPEYICGKSVISADKLITFAKKNNPNFDTSIAKAFISIGEIYGIRGDIAFCQSCVETGYFKYEGSAVTPDQHNYCGLGVTSNGVKGNAFSTVEEGVEAQIQHLFAYASKEDIPSSRKLIDPRFKYVTRGIAPKWIDFNKRWSSTNIYGQTILSVYEKLKTV